MTDDHAARPHGLACPTVADLRASIDRVSRGDQRLWPLLCLAAQVPEDAQGLDALTRLVDAAIALSGGPVRVAAMSVRVRLASYRALSGIYARSAT